MQACINTAASLITPVTSRLHKCNVWSCNAICMPASQHDDMVMA
jgi:hypothetical protein